MTVTNSKALFFSGVYIQELMTAAENLLTDTRTLYVTIFKQIHYRLSSKSRITLLLFSPLRSVFSDLFVVQDTAK